MAKKVRRIFVEKKKGFDVEAQGLYREFKETLGIESLKGIRLINRYDIEGLSEAEYLSSRNTIFSEPPVDYVYDEVLDLDKSARVFAMEFLPGQYDQRADSAAQCVQILTQNEKPEVRTAKVIVLEGAISDEDFNAIKNYCINPLDSKEASLEKPMSLDMVTQIPQDVEIIEGFIDKTEVDLERYRTDMGFAMGLEDLLHCQRYFKNTEKRNPTITELKAIDTYWSDHCRHTTFFTEIDEVTIEKSPSTKIIEKAYDSYLESREYVYGDQNRDICLMDIAVMGMKELRKRGELDDLDVSDEVNACSIVVNVDVNGEDEEWLVMFKNETHNHPTEIEPFGGAATCLGGAIRDPLSGRSYVYQAMRVTGSGDPRIPIADTLPGKLPQRKITTEAANGYSSYGNQIGLATGQVNEIYDNGYIAKRMEVGAVIAAAPKENVVRKEPVEGDVIILVGGRTGRDGCGGATGSSKEHTEESLFQCGAEVQKGNAPTERKIQRLFRNPVVGKMIKRCNDFGAGGVSVAIGELTDSIEIDLDAIPKKYEGLDGTELAISESQERMAVVVAKEDVQRFIYFAGEENLEAVVVAKVTGDGRLRMKWRGKTIFDISRGFLNTNGVKQHTRVFVSSPEEEKCFFNKADSHGDLKTNWFNKLSDLNVASQRGLVEKFDSTIGAGTVLMPLGGKYQLTPAEGMVAKIPVLWGETKTGTIMSFGFNPNISKWSPFHGGYYAVVEAVTKIVSMGGDHGKIRLSLQEYFEKLGDDPQKWGKPFSALLGAFMAQKDLGIPAIGGKDSMSGTFKDLNVPPTLVAFAVTSTDVSKVVSQEFKKMGSQVVLLSTPRDENNLPVMEKLKKKYTKLYELIQENKILATHSVRTGGIAGAISKMSFGNKIGMRFTAVMDTKDIFFEDYGSIIVEVDGTLNIKEVFEDLEFQLLGYTQRKEEIMVNDISIDLEEAIKVWEDPLENIFPTHTWVEGQIENVQYNKRGRQKALSSVAKPRVLIPVFPGTNCEYDMARAFETAGAMVDTFVLKNMTTKDIEESVESMVNRVKKSQIIAIPGGFSGGDEPDGSAKFIATVFRNPGIMEAVMEMLNNRDGLMLGICNGFQALIKLGLVPHGKIEEIHENSPTLTYNKIGRHMSKMVRTKIASTLSPWFNNVELGDTHSIALSHGEGRFMASESVMKQLIANGQVATQYVDMAGNPTYDINHNPNSSYYAVEGITSPDGRVLGKMGHSERVGAYVGINIEGNKEQHIFHAGVKYFL